MQRFIQTLVLMIAVGWAVPGHVAAHAEDGAEVRALYFSSDWCANCVILEPNYNAARERLGDMPIDYLEIDLSAPQNEFQASLNDVLDKRLAWFYNSYLGITGFVVFIAADTTEPIDCVTRVHNSDAIERVARRAVAAVRDLPPGERAPGGILMCPPVARQAPPPSH